MYLDQFAPLLNYSYRTHKVYNIIAEAEDRYRLEIELPGFKKSEFKVFTERGHLKVEGERRDKRTINFSYSIPHNFLVTNVNYEDGLLIVVFDRHVPEHEKRKDYSL